jgi:uncharacterized damage-inducible protein DinB
MVKSAVTEKFVTQRALTELLRGKGAHADPIACVEDLSADLAARQVNGFAHSIGQLVFHMNYWMGYDLRRVRGERPKYPEHNAESFPAQGTPADAAEWERLRQDFVRLLNEHVEMAKSSRAALDREVEPMHPSHKQRAGTVEAILWQTVGHNSYHVGQIVMIRWGLGAWPPKAGGDTW